MRLVTILVSIGSVQGMLAQFTTELQIAPDVIRTGVLGITNQKVLPIVKVNLSTLSYHTYHVKYHLPFCCCLLFRMQRMIQPELL